MKITIVLGSVRKGQQSHKVAYYLEKMLREREVKVDVIDLSENRLPILESRTGNHPSIQHQINTISIRLQQADALLFVTPEYHGSFSGALKNTLDYFWSEFGKKPIGVVAVSAGKLGGINASTQLQHVILSLGAFPLPLKLLIPEIQHAFNESFEPQKESIEKTTNDFLDEFLWFAKASVQAKTTHEKSIVFNS